MWRATGRPAESRADRRFVTVRRASSSRARSTSNRAGEARMRAIARMVLAVAGAVILARRANAPKGRRLSRTRTKTRGERAAATKESGDGGGERGRDDDVNDAEDANARRAYADDANAPEKPRARRETRLVKFGVVEGENRGEDAMDPARTIEDDLFWLRDDERKSD